MSQEIDVIIPQGTQTDPSVDVENEEGGRDRVGTSADDRLRGTSNSDEVSGLSGNDLIATGQGLDTISAGDGNDTVDAGSDNDTVQGNRGGDSLVGGSGSDSLRGGKDNDTLDGGEGVEQLWGDSGDDLVRGRAGDDDLLGNAGSDIIEGGDGNDEQVGGKDGDSLNGGGGDDFLSGDRANDTLTGGTGADDFFFWFNSDGSYGVDTITDFNRDEGDKIVLAANPALPTDAIFSTLSGTPTGAPLPADQFAVIENFSSASSDGVTQAIIYDPANGFIYYNPSTATGDEAQIAQVDNTVYDVNNPLQNTDFEIF